MTSWLDRSTSATRRSSARTGVAHRAPARRRAPRRFARVVAANTFLPTGDRHPGEAFLAWQRFSQETPEFPVGTIVNGGCTTDLTPEVVAAYDAPFPDETYKEGARQFPMLVPSSPDDPAAGPTVRRGRCSAAGRSRSCARSATRIRSPGAPTGCSGPRSRRRGPTHIVISGGGHFLQEDRGEQLVRVSSTSSMRRHRDAITMTTTARWLPGRAVGYR